MDMRIRSRIWQANHNIKIKTVYSQEDDWIDPKDDPRSLKALIREQRKEENWPPIMTRSEYECEVDLRLRDQLERELEEESDEVVIPPIYEYLKKQKKVQERARN